MSLIKGRILVIPYGEALSHTTRPLLIARELVKFGWEIIFAGNGPYMKMASEEGFPVHSLPEVPLSVNIRKMRKLDMKVDEEKMRSFVEAEIELYKKIKPEAVLTDCRVTASTSTKICRLPHIAIINASWTPYYSVKPEIYREFKLIRRIFQPFIDQHWDALRWATIQKTSAVFNRILAEYGCADLEFPLMGNDLNLIPDIPEFAPTENLSFKFKYIGPLIWQFSQDSTDWSKIIRRNRPIIYLTMGSTGPQEINKFLSKLKKRFNRKGFQVIVSTGNQIPEGSLESSDNFIVKSFVYAENVLPFSDLVLCHGGSGTIYQALSYGVPVITIPYNPEQEAHAQRVEQLQLGERLPWNKVKGSPQKIIQAIERVLNNLQFKENALKMRELISKYNPPQFGAELIDQFLKAKLKI